MVLDAKVLKDMIDVEEKKIADAETTFKASLEALQAQYQELTKDKEDKEAAIKDAGLGLMKACAAHSKKSGTDEL
jgi:hypothetical protein